MSRQNRVTKPKRQAWAEYTAEARADLPSIQYGVVCRPDGTVRALLWSGRRELRRLLQRRGLRLSRPKGPNRHARRAAAAGGAP